MKPRRIHGWWRLGHAWSGLFCSLLLVIISLSGTLLVFKDEWTRLTVPTAREQPPLDVETLARVAESAERHFGKSRLSAVRFATQKLGVHRVYFTDGGGAYLDGSGDIVESWAANGRAEDWLLHLHYTLLAGETGRVLAGVVALVAAVLVVSGIVVWWPARRTFRNRLWPRSSRRGELLSVHRDVGLWAAIPILVLSLSGVAMVFHGPALAVLNGVFGDEPSSPKKATLDTPLSGTRVQWREAMLAGTRLFPDASPRIVSWPRGESPARIRFRQRGEWHPNGRSTISFQPGKGFSGFVDAMTLGRGATVFNAMYPVHAARVGGTPYKAVVLVSGLALTLLGVIGSWSFLKRMGKGSHGVRVKVQSKT